MEVKLTEPNRVADTEYFARRAREERDRAIICEDNSAAIAHLKMADEYERRATGEIPRVAIVVDL